MMHLLLQSIALLIFFQSEVIATKCKLPLHQRLEKFAPHQPQVFQELMLPMRDGVKLHTIALSPLFSSKKKWPTVIDRSPYGAFNTELLADLYLLFDFAAVSQDMRGCCQSEGNFTVWHSDENDGLDTVAWILKQPWSDGTVYQIGASADGIGAFELAKGHPTALAGQFIIFATAEARRTFLPGGTYRQNLIEKWLKGTVPNQAQGLIDFIKTQEAPSSWWDAVEIKGDQFNAITWPTVHWAGWFDIFLHGHLYSYDGFQKHASKSVVGDSWLVVDPCGHCQDAAKYFPHNLIAGRSLLPILMGIQLFQDTSKSKHFVPAENVKSITFYVMSTSDNVKEGNYWTTLDDWPNRTITPWYLHGDGTLSSTKPTVADLTTSIPTSSTYDYDPSNPTPSNGGNNLLMHCGPLDQTAIENRSDVVVFTSAPLSNSIAITGELDVDLYVSSANVNDTDFSVRLTDVHPDGQTSQLVQDGIQRMRWRISEAQKIPEPMLPNQIYKIRVSLWNTSFIFPKGHSIRVSVSSSNYPRFEANPNTGLPLYMEDGTKIIAKNTVYHEKNYPSNIRLPIVQLSDLPKHNILNTEQSIRTHLLKKSKDELIAAKMLDDIMRDIEKGGL